MAGSNEVAGIAYVEAAFSYSKSHLWRNFGILIAFFIGFAVMQVIAMEFLAKGAAAVKVNTSAAISSDRYLTNSVHSGRRRLCQGKQGHQGSKCTTR